MRPFFLACLIALAAAAPLAAQDVPLIAGSEGVPVPKRTKMVKPEYPAEAQAKGLRGIVILDVTIDKDGKVGGVDIVRSIPGLDEAAIAAVRKWEYEPAKVAGKPVAVKLTVPITFLMQLPEISRQDGIPELRQGAVPTFPKGVEAQGTVSALAEISINAEGRVVEAEIRSGNPPYTEALLQAVRGWLFAPDTARDSLSFRVQADFIAGSQPRVVLALTGLRRSESTPATQAPAAPPAASPSSTGPTTAPPTVPAPTPAASLPTPLPVPKAAAAPTTEVLRSTVEPPVAAPEAGVSVLRDVALAPGVPDLTKGRRPVPPPLARMAGVVGAVEVRFAIDAAGGVSIQGSQGPDLLRPAAEAAILTWTFRRTSTDRLRAIAELTYRDDGVVATVKLEP